MATTEEYLLASSATTLLSTELNALASSSGLTAGAISSVGGSSGVFNNVSGAGYLGGYIEADFALTLAAPAGTLSAGTGAYVWLLRTLDGTHYETGSTSVIPARAPDLIIPVDALSTAQLVIVPGRLPRGTWYVLLAQNTGQTWASSGNTLSVLPSTRQGV
jgi:hypothetical protein